MVDFVQQSWQALWAIPHIRAWLTVAWIGYLLWLGSWIVLQKREPVATISWLVSLAALPYIGFFIYYLFGPQRIRRHRLQRSRTRVGMASEVPGGDDAVELARLGLATTGLPQLLQAIQGLEDATNSLQGLIDEVRASPRDFISRPPSKEIEVQP